MQKILLLGALALGACSPATIAAIGAAGGTAASIASTVKGGAVVLSDVAQAACAAQAAANVAGAVSSQRGDVKTAQQASTASALLGAGCSWVNPAPGR